MRNRTAGAVLAAVLALALGVGVAAAQRGPRIGQRAPEITGGPWINSEPLSLDLLRGRVVLVEFWTHGCYNCKNVIPSLRKWHATYAARGLTIVGVHTPEFPWEKPYAAVVAAARALGVQYPVVQDNDTAIWRRYGNWAWPAAVLVDRAGVIRYTHVGEGAYARTEQVIQELLAER
jgi:thiol-disulfide isomerase/thioredoxin